MASRRAKIGRTARGLIVTCLVGGCAALGPDRAGTNDAATAARGAPGLEGSRPAATDTEATGDGVGGSTPVHGFASVRYRPRWTDDDSDHDLYAVLSVDVGDPEADPLTVHAMGRVAWDLDGRDAQNGTEVFGSLEDTYEESVNAQLYHAYVDAQGMSDGFDVLRAGRQRVWRTPETVVFDGVRLDTRGLGDHDLILGLYGGVPTHYFESSSSGDALVGLFAEGRPWSTGRVRLDWMHLDDEARLTDLSDDLLGVRVWERLLPDTLLEGGYTRLESRDRDMRFRATHAEPEHDLSFSITYYELLEPQRELALELDPFIESLRTYFPFWQTTVTASKGLGERMSLQAGFDVRRVTDDADAGEFNRDYERYFAALAIEELTAAGIWLNLTGDVWDSDELETQTWGLDVGKHLGERYEASLGSYYSLYKYDPFTDSERDDVRTYFARLKCKCSKDLSFTGSYELEDDEFDDYHVVKLGATWRF